MKTTISLIVLVISNCLLERADALQMILTSKEPSCVSVYPNRAGGKISLNYVVTGVNENQVSFSVRSIQLELTPAIMQAKQDGVSLLPTESTGVTNFDQELRTRSKKVVEFCWTKLDRKSKKVTFLIQQETQDHETKANADTVEGVVEQIDALALKLDKISMNIVSQKEVEKDHFERKCN